MLVDDPKLFSDSEITLRDVIRAQEIVDRAKKILERSLMQIPDVRNVDVTKFSWSIPESAELDQFVKKIITS